MEQDKEIRLDLFRDEGFKTFRTVSELRSWIESERTIWTAFESDPDAWNRRRFVLITQPKHLESLLGYIATPNFIEGDPVSLDRLKTALATDFKGKIISSDSARGIFLLDHANRDIALAYYLLAFFEGASVESTNPKIIRAHVESYLFENGMSGRLGYDVEAMNRSMGQISSIAAMAAETAVQAKAKMVDLIGSAEKAISSFEESQKKQLELVLSNHVHDRERQEADLNALKLAYEAQMQLSAPSSYWKLKARRHRNHAIAYAVLSVLAFGIGFSLLFVFWRDHISAENQRSIGNLSGLLLRQPEQSQQIPWRGIGFFLIYSSAIIWVLRVVVKLFLSSLHLYADANERRVMIMTYLAMARSTVRQDKPSKEEMGMLLASIFRPSAVGLLSDEGGPIGASEMLQAAITKAKGG